MRKIFMLCLALTATLLLPSSPTNAQEGQNLRLIGNGEVVEGSLRDNITAVMYAVNILGGDTVDVSLTQTGTPFTPLITILGPAGQVVATGEDQVEATVEFTGTYFVLVTTLDAVDGAGIREFDEPLEYDLAATVGTPPDFDSLAYFLSPLEYDTSFEGYSSPPEPVFYFAFEGTANEVIDVVVTSRQIDPIVFLFDSRGNRLAVNDDAETLNLPAPTDSAIERFTIPATGLYFVFVTDIAFHEIPLATGGNLDVNSVANVFSGGDFTITLER